MSAEISTAKMEDEGAGMKSPNYAYKWILISLVVGALIWMLPTPEGLSVEAHRFLALLATVVLLWTSEAIPIGVTLSSPVRPGRSLLLGPPGSAQSSPASWQTRRLPLC